MTNSLLMDAEAYAGFAYLRADELAGEAKGNPPGIVWNANGEGHHNFPDETRIRFISKGI